MSSRTSSDTTGQGIPTPPASLHAPAGARPGDPDDELLAALLIRMWALASGRTLRHDIPPVLLSEEELISFWADDMSPPAGRHVLPREPETTAAGQAARSSRGKDRRSPPARSAHGCKDHLADPAAA